MRIYKDSSGNFAIDDEPLRIEGEDATRFLASMTERDAGPPDPERKRFLDECVAIYRRHAPAAAHGEETKS